MLVLYDPPPRPRGDLPHGLAHGRAVQVDPMKPKLKPSGTKRLKLKCDILPSTSAFNFNLRRCITAKHGAVLSFADGTIMMMAECYQVTNPPT